MKLRKLLGMGLVACFLAQSLTGCGNASDSAATAGAEEAGTKETPETAEDGTPQSQSDASEEKADGAVGTNSDVHKEGLPIVDEEQTLSVLTISTHPEVEPSEVVIHQEIEAATNVKIEWTVIPVAAWAERKGLTLAQSELPDIMLGDACFSDTDLQNMIDAGQVIAIDGLIEDYAPNFKKIMENQPELKPSITNDDGHIYGLPQYIGSEGATRGVTTTNRVTYINKTWLDNLNLAMPTTTEELHEVLKAFKEGDPNGNGQADEIPLSTYTDNQYFADWFGAFGLVPNANENNYENIAIKDGKVVFSAAEEEYKEGVNYFHQLWADGLIDPETFTQDSAMFNSKLKSETRIIGMFSAWRGTAWRLSNEDEEYVVLPPLEGPDGDRLYPEMFNGVSSRAGCVITSSCSNPELAMRWVDNLVSPENGYQFWTKAKIGYNLEDTGEEQYKLVKQLEVDDPEYIRQVMLGFTCVDHTTMNRKPTDPDPLNVDNEKQAADVFYKDCYPQEHFPNVFLNKEEGKIMAELQPQLKSYVDQTLAKWITSGGVEEEWEGYVEQLKSMGLDDYIAQFQTALDRYNSAQ